MLEEGPQDQKILGLGLLLADGALTMQWGGGRLFDTSTSFISTKTALTRERKVEKSLPRWEMNCLSKGYKQAVDQNWGHMAKIGFFGQKTEILGPK